MLDIIKKTIQYQKSLRKQVFRKHYGHSVDGLAGTAGIATGVIEGACRHLINDRLDITGARWGLQCAEAILKLRSINSSGYFESY